MKFTCSFLKILNNQRGSVGFLGSEGASNQPENNPAPINDGISYPEGFDETLKGNQSLLKFYDKEKKSFNLSNLAKSYVNAESLLGKDKIPVPNETYNEDQWNQVFDKLGRPAREKYEVKNSVAENMQADPEFFNKYLDAAHKSGLLPKQAQAIVDFFNAESSTIMQKEAESEKAALQEGIANLQKEWGNNYKANVEKASEALFMFASDPEIKEMKEAGLLDNPVFTKIFHKIADSLKEDKFKTEVRDSFGMSRDDIQTKIESFYRPDHPFMQKNHPNKQYYQDQMLKMQRDLLKMN